MANDYMAKLAADLEGMSMMREPEPMPIIYRQDGGDFGGFGNFGDDFGDYGPGGASDAGTGGGDTGGGADPNSPEAIAAAVAADKEQDVKDNLEDYYGKSGTFESPSTASFNPMGGFDYSISGASGPPGTYGRFMEEFNKSGYAQVGKSKNRLLQEWEKEGIPKEYWPLFTDDVSKAAQERAARGLSSSPGTFVDAYNEGYSFGGPQETLEGIIGKDTDKKTSAIKKQVEKNKKEVSESAYFEDDEEEEKGTFDILGDYISQAFTGKKGTEYIQAAQDLGFIVSPLSTAEKVIGGAAATLIPGYGTISGITNLAGKNIVAQVTDPTTGQNYLMDASGSLQTPGTFNTQDDGGEPDPMEKYRNIIEKKPTENVDVTEDVNKPGFPQQILPRLTPSDRATLEKILGPNNPLLDKYATGIQALV
jgi:hypothetical protein